MTQHPGGGRRRLLPQQQKCDSLQPPPLATLPLPAPYHCLLCLVNVHSPRPNFVESGLQANTELEPLFLQQSDLLFVHTQCSLRKLNWQHDFPKLVRDLAHQTSYSSPQPASDLNPPSLWPSNRSLSQGVAKTFLGEATKKPKYPTFGPLGADEVSPRSLCYHDSPRVKSDVGDRQPRALSPSMNMPSRGNSYAVRGTLHCWIVQELGQIGCQSCTSAVLVGKAGTQLRICTRHT